MSQIHPIEKEQSHATKPYAISQEQVRIFPTLNDQEKEGVVLFETLSYHFSSGVIEILARHIPYVDFETKLYIAEEIMEESGHFTRCANTCQLLGLTPRDFFPNVRQIYAEPPNWLRYVAGCPFTLEQTAVHVFAKFLPGGSRYFQPVSPFLAEDVDHFSQSHLQIQRALNVSDESKANQNRLIVTDAIKESLHHYAPPFFDHLTKVITLGTSLTPAEVNAEWCIALDNLKKTCEELGLQIESQRRSLVQSLMSGKTAD